MPNQAKAKIIETERGTEVMITIRNAERFFRVGPAASTNNRQSNARTGSRRAHDAKKPKQISYCPQCSTAVPSHVVCPNCGHYMGRKVVETES